jgi:ATP-dependent Clp protease protease subunit
VGDNDVNEPIPVKYKIKMKKEPIWSSKEETTNSTSDSNNQITTANNHIYFYSEVERDKMLELNKSINELDKELQINSLKLGTELPKIYLHINSYGGSIFAGMSTLDTIRNTKCEVVTIIEGCAASAATMISIVGKERQIHKHAHMLIHQLSGVSWGNYSELVDDMENKTKLMNMIKKLYKEYTKVPKNELDEILKHDLWWDAEKCLEYGLVDKIVG